MGLGLKSKLKEGVSRDPYYKCESLYRYHNSLNLVSCLGILLIESIAGSGRPVLRFLSFSSTCSSQQALRVYWDAKFDIADCFTIYITYYVCREKRERGEE